MYDRTVARSEQLYAGPLSLADAEPVHGELWHSDGTAVAYMRPPGADRPTVGGVMKNAVVELVEGQLVAMGTVDGEPAVWRSVTPERIHSSYARVDVTLPDGRRVEGAMVSVSNLKARIEGGGLTEAIDLPAATVRVYGTRDAVIESPGIRLPMRLPKRGCGCGGSR